MGPDLPSTIEGWWAASPGELKGATLDPVAAGELVRADPNGWGPWIQRRAAEGVPADEETMVREVRHELVRKTADLFRKMFDASGRQDGFVSGPVDPRDAFNEERMFGQGVELSRVAPNVMVAVPATSAGLRVLRRLTELGIPTHATAVFTVSQMLACARVVQDAEAVGRKRGHDFSRWQSLLGFMPGRMEELGSLEEEGRTAHADWTDDDRHRAGVAVCKRAWDLLRTDGHRSRILLGAIRTDADGRCRHVDETGGGGILYAAEAGLRDRLASRPSVPGHSMIEPVPDAVMKKLLALPYFRECYGGDAQAPARFDRFAPMIRTLDEYASAERASVDIIRAALASGG